MGCCISKETVDSAQESLSGNIGVDYFPKNEVDVSNYMCTDVYQQTVVKQPGQLNGEDFVIENCKEAKIYLLDTTAAVTIDNCIDCQLFIGPCKGSIFLRDSKQCTIMASCQQFRSRDTNNCTIYLHCITQPVIESCTLIKFGCFSCYYPQLKDQLQSAMLSPLTNNWYSVHDFTPEYSQTWSMVKPNDGSNKLTNDDNIELSFHTNNSTIPYTIGMSYLTEDTEICLMMFQGSDITDRALEVIKQLENKACLLIAKNMMMKGTGLIQFFSDSNIAPSNLKDGEVVFLLVEGSNCIELCSEAINANSSNNSTNTYYSPDYNQGRIDQQKFTQILISGVSMT